MVFDPKIHEVKQILIKCGRALREAKGLPEEKNITVLYNEASAALGLPLIETSTVDADSIPIIHEMKFSENEFFIPRKDCPDCKRKGNMIFGPICPSCKDSEKGVYKSMWFCGQMDKKRQLIPGTGCGFKEKSKRFISQYLADLGIEPPTGTKKSLGIKTFTDEGMI